MNKITYKVKWKVTPAPTGPYKSFEKRGWPFGWYAGDREIPAARIECDTDYVPSQLEKGNHAPLRLYVADHSVTPWKWRKVKGEFKTLAEAKDGLTTVLNGMPRLVPSSKVEEKTG